MAELENIIGSIISSPESMEKVMEIAKLFGGEGEKPPQTEQKPPSFEGAVPNISPELLSKIMALLNEYNAEDDRRIHLLGAIRPYVKDSDSFHIDRAIRIVKLSRVAKGALGSFLK